METQQQGLKQVLSTTAWHSCCHPAGWLRLGACLALLDLAALEVLADAEVGPRLSPLCKPPAMLAS